jgi:xylulokinase
MKRNEPGLFREIHMVCDVQTYLIWKLTGSWMTSWASADPLGLFDIRNKKWAALILDTLELTRDQLPRLCRPGTVIGTINRGASDATGLSTDTAIIAGGGDGQAAGLGANVLSSERAYLNLGTAVVAGVFGSHYRTSQAFRTMCSCSDRGYYFECSLRAGTFAIDWLIRKVLNIDLLPQSDIYERLQLEAQQVPPGSDGLLHLPYLCGVMNPFWDMNARGAFIGMSSSHHRGHLYRSILEGIAFEQLFAISSVEKNLGSRVKEFVAIGGGATSELWCRIFADITGRTLCIPGNTEASALGVAIAAAVGTGWYRTFQEAADRMTRIERTIAPNEGNRRTYKRLFEIYRTMYPSLRKLGATSSAG